MLTVHLSRLACLFLTEDMHEEIMKMLTEDDKFMEIPRYNPHVSRPLCCAISTLIDIMKIETGQAIV